MKKITAILVVLCMLLSMVPAMAESGTLLGEGEEGGFDLGGLFGGEDGFDLGGLFGGEDGIGSKVDEWINGEDGIGSKVKDLINGEDGIASKVKDLFSGENGIASKVNELINGENGIASKVSGLASKAQEYLADKDIMSMLQGLFGGTSSDAEGDKSAPAAVTESFVAAESIDQFYGVWTLSKAMISGYPISLEEVAAMLEVPVSFQLVLAEGSFSMILNGEEQKAEVEMELVDGALQMKTGDEISILKLTAEGELVMVSDAVNLYFVPGVLETAETAEAAEEPAAANE